MNIFQVSELSASFHTIGVGYNSLVEVGSFFALLTLIFLTFLAPSLSRVTRVLPPTHWLRIVTNLLTPSYLSISICTFEKEQFSKEREREKKQTDKTFILITADGGGSVPDSTLRVYSISNGWKVGKLLVLCDLNGCEDDGSEVNNKRHWIKLGGWMHSKIARHNRRREMCIQLSCCAPLGSFTRRAGATVERQRAAAIDADVYTTGVWRYQLGFFSPSSSLFCAAFLYESVRVVIACRRLDSNSIVTSQLVSDQEAAAHNDFSLSPTLPLRCCFYPAFGFPFSFTCRLLGLIDAKPPSISAHEQPTYTAFLAKPYRPFVRH